jgi:hypothetical protein
MLALRRTIGVTHEYQSDSSSKRPAPSAFDAYKGNKRTTKKCTDKRIFLLLTEVVPYQEFVFWVAPPSESSGLAVGFMVGLAKSCLNPKTGVSMPPGIESRAQPG